MPNYIRKSKSQFYFELNAITLLGTTKRFILLLFFFNYYIFMNMKLMPLHYWVQQKRKTDTGKENIYT